MKVSLERITALELAARSLLVLVVELRKEAESETPDTAPTPPPAEPTDDGNEPCPVGCAARYRVQVSVMGKPGQTKCRMCSRLYE